MARRGWLSQYDGIRNGLTWIYHFYVVKPETGKLVENTASIGPVSQFSREIDAWAEVKRRHLISNDGQVAGKITVEELIENYRKKNFKKLRDTTQSTTAHILNNYLMPRWGKSLALAIQPDHIEEWLDALSLANPTKERIRRVMNVVYRRGQKSHLLPRTGEGNPVAFVTQSSKSDYKAVIVSPEQVFRIMEELQNPCRTLVFVVAVTGLRISEALGLRWGDLDFDGHIIQLRRVWVGKNMINHLKTESSGAPVPLGDLLADTLKSWHNETLYSKPDDWVFPSAKMKGKKPLSASIMAADKLRPAALKAGVRLAVGQRFGFHNLRHSLATFLISRDKDVKTVQELMRHAKVATTLDLYSQAIDDAKLEAQQEVARAITGRAAAD